MRGRLDQELQTLTGLNLSFYGRAHGESSWRVLSSSLPPDLQETARSAIFRATTSASSALAVKIDTKAPDAPKIGSFSSDGKAVSGGAVDADHVTLTGTAEANSVVKVLRSTWQRSRSRRTVGASERYG